MDGLQQVLSKNVVDKLLSANLFMIGAGAIGCELLKNFAMIGVGSGQDGMITLTNPDHIETSNLSRQFLFREKHITKPKSQTAAAAAIQMNPSLKNHIYADSTKYTLQLNTSSLIHFSSNKQLLQAHQIMQLLDYIWIQDVLLIRNLYQKVAHWDQEAMFKLYYHI